MTTVKSPPPVWILIAVTATGPIALNIFVPSMPTIAREFDAPYATIQLTLTLYLFALAVAQLLYGPFSDRYGRRPLMIVGLVLYAAANLFCYFTWSAESLIVGRIIQAVGGCAGMVLSRAVVRDVFDREQSAGILAHIMMVMAIAPAIAPAIGGNIEVYFGWRTSFLLLTVVAIVILVATLKTLSETNMHPAESLNLSSMIASYKQLLGSVPFMGYAFCTSLSSCAFFSFLAGAPFIMIEILDRSAAEYGYYFIMISITYMFGNYITSRLSIRLGINRLIIIGVGVSLVGAVMALGLSLAGIIAPWALFVPVGIIAVGNGISQANAVAAAVSVFPKIAGAASGLTGFMQMAIGGAGTVIVGAYLSSFPVNGLNTIIFVATALSLVAFVVGALSSRRSNLRETS